MSLKLRAPAASDTVLGDMLSFDED